MDEVEKYKQIVDKIKETKPSSHTLKILIDYIVFSCLLKSDIDPMLHKILDDIKGSNIKITKKGFKVIRPETDDFKINPGDYDKLR